MVFKKGHKINVGRTYSKERNEKIAIALNGKKRPDAVRLKISKSLKGRDVWIKGKKHSDETKKKISDKLKGRTSPTLGLKFTDETKIKMSNYRKGRIYGNCNPNWKGGLSFEPYCHKFNEKFKEHIRNRDNRICQLCGVNENGRKLDVHHIHYDKPNCNPDVISLCQKCNLKANSRREFHELFFMENLKVRGLVK